MGFKNLLVHLDDSPACAGRLAVAIDLARAYDAHLTGLHVASDPVLHSGSRGEIPARFMATLQQQADKRAQTVITRFTDALAKSGLSADVRAARGAAADFAGIVALHARHADLIILGQPEPEPSSDIGEHFAEDVILSSGRPALVVPYIGAGKRLGRRVLVAWDSGREAARAVNDALPFLKRADKVAVLVINPDTGDHGPQPGAEIALHLARHGVRAEAQHLTAGDLSVANALLSRLVDLDIDLLVMGAYGHSRLREWILGGVTREIFRQMTVPVLMAR